MVQQIFTFLHLITLTFPRLNHTCDGVSQYKLDKFRAAAAKSLQLCPTLSTRDGSPPGSSIPGILQARILEWVAISFSNVSSEK